MATNYIKLFGEEVNTSGKGITFNDSTWNTAGSNYSNVRKTGFKPNQPVSSLALNTALRQASVGAKMIGDILVDSTLGIRTGTQHVSTDGDIEAKVGTYVDNLVSYLNKINQLINGGQVANRALYAATSSDTNSIYQSIKRLTDELDISNENGYRYRLQSGEIPVGVATYYYDNSTNTKIEIDSALYDLEDKMRLKSSTVSFNNARADNENFTIYKQGGVVYSNAWGTVAGIIAFNPYIDVTNYTGLIIGNGLQIGTIPDGYRPDTTKTIYTCAEVRGLNAQNQEITVVCPVCVQITKQGQITIWIIREYVSRGLHLHGLWLHVGYNLS